MYGFVPILGPAFTIAKIQLHERHSQRNRGQAGCSQAQKKSMRIYQPVRPLTGIQRLSGNVNSMRFVHDLGLGAGSGLGPSDISEIARVMVHQRERPRAKGRDDENYRRVVDTLSKEKGV